MRLFLPILTVLFAVTSTHSFPASIRQTNSSTNSTTSLTTNSTTSLTTNSTTNLTTNSTTNSTCPIDFICYAIDQSGSIGSLFYPEEQQFVIDFSREIANRTNGTQYSAYGFAGSSRLISNSTTDLEGVFIPAIQQPTSFGGTNIGAGLQACFDELSPLGTPQDNKIIVVITDGNGGNALANSIRPDVINENIDIITVGIGSGVNTAFLQQLASMDSFFLASQFGDLVDDAIAAVDLTCKAASMPGTNMTSCESAYADCDFTFANGSDMLRTFPLGDIPDVAFTPRIIYKDGNETLGVLNTNNFIPEFILDNGTVVNITEAMAMPAFTPTHFKPFSIDGSFGSGIGYQTFQGNQSDVAAGQCVRVRFSSFQTLASTSPLVVEENFNDVPFDSNKCVVFRTAN